jgi:hypothetical protein
MILAPSSAHQERRRSCESRIRIQTQAACIPRELVFRVGDRYRHKGLADGGWQSTLGLAPRAIPRLL